MISLYVSAFNLESGPFSQDWEESLNKMYDFSEELVIGTTSDSQDNTINLLNEYVKNRPKSKLVITDFKLNSPDFDGNIKNAALQSTTEPIKVLLDLDEEIPLSTKEVWEWHGKFLLSEESKNVDGLLIASINLCKSMKTFKDIGYKFYMHKAGLKRGIINQAKNQDGSIDITKSDTTEPLDINGNLGRFMALPNQIHQLKSGRFPYVFHKWAVSPEKRIEQNKYWKPVWENRAQREVNDIIMNKEKIEKMEVFEHKLPLE